MKVLTLIHDLTVVSSPRLIRSVTTEAVVMSNKNHGRFAAAPYIGSLMISRAQAGADDHGNEQDHMNRITSLASYPPCV